MFYKSSLWSVCTRNGRTIWTGAYGARIAVLSLGLFVLLLAACHDPVSPIESELSSNQSEFLLGQEIAASKAAVGHAPVITFEDMMTQVGTSQLVRTRNGVNYKLSTTGLQGGHAYTLWIVIFNNTDGCDHGTPGITFCGPDDVVNDDARPDMMYAGGHVAGGSGEATFSGRRGVGDLSGSINEPVDVPAYGLEDAFGAEIHLVVHQHGPKMAAYMPDMIKTVDGGCMDAGIPFEGAESPWNLHDGFGRRGPNTCQSIHFAVHSPNAL